MKKISVILLMLLSISVYSQKNRSAERMNRAEGSVKERAAQMAERMGAYLELDEGQKDKIKIAYKEQGEEWKSLRAERRENQEENRETRNERRAERREVFAKRQQVLEERIRAILTEEQFKEWKELASERRGQRTNRTRKQS